MTSLSNFLTLEDREVRVRFHPRCLLLIECYKSSCSIIHSGKSAQSVQGLAHFTYLSLSSDWSYSQYTCPRKRCLKLKNILVFTSTKVQILPREAARQLEGASCSHRRVHFDACRQDILSCVSLQLS